MTHKVISDKNSLLVKIAQEEGACVSGEEIPQHMAVGR
jgi:hypothetical protein